MQRDDDSRRSRWSAREGERWWLGAVTYGGGTLAMAVVAAAVVALLLEELWIVLVVAAGVPVLVGVALAALVHGDW